MGTDKPVDFDIYIQKNNGLFEIFSGSSKGEAILKKLKYKNAAKLKIKPVYNEDGKIDIKNISALVENRKQLEECWQGIADNCFGCGACTVVCPLCFCTRQSFTNDLDGGFKQCLDWDSCFAKRFSEIQNRVDLRSKNIDRLYNWYHHKFVRAPFEKKHFLCTGCGRCAFACPANLNIKKILRNLIDKNNE
jgi:sulfhydrogenase subunit beta (sulfur reductase)